MNKIKLKYLLKQLGLKEDDYDDILFLLARKPTLTELAIYSAMWSEHCSYKTSKYWLKKLPTNSKCVIQGPGENAGVIDIGKGNAIVFKIESHNHPSFIEPYQGAATGVGGIMRDIFTMGARPIANLNCLRFGSVKNNKTKHLFNGVVSGVGDYGNCTGIPTVAGECSFDERYNNNILVNAMTIGLAKKNKIFYAKAGKAGNLVIYVGSKTGKDGINGASMSSGAFNTKTETLKPTVQVGDPFTEKLLMEACIELMNKNALIGIQDMGAAGLTSSSVEIAASGSLGITLNLDKVPLRDISMTSDEIMLSESQERMLIIIKPEKVKIAKEIFKKWSLDFATIGKITSKNTIEILHKKIKVADIPIKSLVSAKIYRRPFLSVKNNFVKKTYKNKPIAELVKEICLMPNLGNKDIIWQQYDHMITRNVINEIGGNASIIKTNTEKQAIAVTTDCNIYYCDTNPYLGAIQAISESYRNLISVGAKPLAITNCLNFGNPEKSKVMGQFVDTIKGMIIASKHLNLPIVSGNVSFYNETNDKNIPPTPQIGAVGVVDNFDKVVSYNSFSNQDNVYIVGTTEGHLSCSVYERCFYKFSETKNSSIPPTVDLKKELKNAQIIDHLIRSNLISACHDISDGGLIMALVKMCTSRSVSIKFKNLIKNHGFLFGEDQSRYVMTVNKHYENEVETYLSKQNIFYKNLGNIDNSSKVLKFPDKSSISLMNINKYLKIWQKRFKS